MTEFLARELPKTDLTFHTNSPERVTYHDPCRLGRLAGIYDAPRQLIDMLPQVTLLEMERIRENALCCGTSAWMECTSHSKVIQTERMQEAIQTGAQTLITACPKCQVHLTCAMRDVNRIRDLYMEIKDLSSVIAESLEGDDAA